MPIPGVRDQESATPGWTLAMEVAMQSLDGSGGTMTYLRAIVESREFAFRAAMIAATFSSPTMEASP